RSARACETADLLQVVRRRQRVPGHLHLRHQDHPARHRGHTGRRQPAAEEGNDRPARRHHQDAAAQREVSVGVERNRATWERLGNDDPLWAIMPYPAEKSADWDLDEFMATGVADID